MPRAIHACVVETWESWQSDDLVHKFFGFLLENEELRALPFEARRAQMAVLRQDWAAEQAAEEEERLRSHSMPDSPLEFLSNSTSSDNSEATHDDKPESVHDNQPPVSGRNASEVSPAASPVEEMDTDPRQPDEHPACPPSAEEMLGEIERAHSFLDDQDDVDLELGPLTRTLGLDGTFESKVPELKAKESKSAEEDEDEEDEEEEEEEDDEEASSENNTPPLPTRHESARAARPAEVVSASLTAAGQGSQMSVSESRVLSLPSTGSWRLTQERLQMLNLIRGVEVPASQRRHARVAAYVAACADHYEEWAAILPTSVRGHEGEEEEELL